MLNKMNINAIAIIPAKTDSVRLKKKNLQIINNKTLVEYSIIYALRSSYIKEVYVNTESEEIKKYTENYDIKIIDRDINLMGKTEVVDVYIKSFNKIKELTNLKTIDIVVGIQPDHPDRELDIDKAIEYFVENTYDDLFTVDNNGTRNGSIRITKAKHVESGLMSKRVGSLVDNCTNIHDENDLYNAGQNLLNNDKE